MPHSKKILFCNCSYSKIIPAEIKGKILDAIDDSSINYQVVDDLCQICVDHDPKLESSIEEGPVTIVACYGRAVRWLFKVAGIELKDTTDILNMREQSAEDIIQSLTGSEPVEIPQSNAVATSKPTDWIPWFPVIDYSRCTNCKQCLNFCLFNVYGTSDDGKVTVSNPRKCKTNCPACARVCPEAAIIFPKYKTAPFNGSDEAASPGSTQKVDLKSITQGDLYNKLRQRSCGCDSPDQCGSDNSVEKLTELKEQLDIPDDVIQSLNPAGAGATSSSEPCDCDCDCKTDADGLCICETGGQCPCDCECKDNGDSQV